MNGPHNSNRRTVLRMMGAGLVSGAALSGTGAAHRGGLQRELADIRSATAQYNDPANAVADGYRPSEHAVCGMGYHYVNPGLIGRTDRTQPQVLAYGEDEDGTLLLGAVEYLVPQAGPYSESPPDLFSHDGGEEHWGTLNTPNGTLWALHVWVHTHNPEGAFNHVNPRPQFCPEDGEHDH